MNDWYKRNPEKFECFKKLIDENYPTLNVFIENGNVVVVGTLVLKDESGKETEKFRIKIKTLPDYPKSVPTVWELDGRIPMIPDAHMNKEQGACLFFRDERYKYFPLDSTIVDFIEGPVKSYFIGAGYYLIKKVWPNEIRTHFIGGLYDSYIELLKGQGLSIENGDLGKKIILKFLSYLNMRNIDERKKCFCGSGGPIKNCHLEFLKEMQKKIDPEDLAKSLKEVKADIYKIS